MDTLRLTHPMMHGAAVRRCQEMLDGIGGKRVDADGIYGPATKAAVEAFQRIRGLAVDGICGPATWMALLKAADNLYMATPPRPGPKEGMIDLTNAHQPPRLAAGLRALDDIDGVTLHQTGCPMPSAPAGWSRLNAHVGVTQEGLLLLVNPPEMMIWHAQGLSRRTIGIEIEGNYRGLINKTNTLWKGGGPACHLNEAMLAALDRLFAWLRGTLGDRWRYVFAHRQSANSRMADPGEEIWRAVGLPWLAQRKATTGPSADYCCGTGRPVPREWGATTDVRYWCDAREKA